MKGAVWVILMFSLLYPGCSPETRYKVLSFLVDGVPPPEKVLGKGEEIKKGKESGIQKLKVAIHGPYGARMCTACHEAGVSNRLLLPKEKLCYRCHSFKMEARWIHGPIASGGCMLCHDPHNSKYEYLLVGSSQEFCFYCHQRSAVHADESHSKVMQKGCTTCHDAHMSDRQFLLKEDVALLERTTKVEEDSRTR